MNWCNKKKCMLLMFCLLKSFQTIKNGAVIS